MNTAQATSAATAANTPAPWPVNNAMALAWAANLGQAFTQARPCTYNAIPISANPRLETEIEVFDPAADSYDAGFGVRSHNHVRMVVGDKNLHYTVNMTRHEAAWLVRGLVDTIAASLVRDGKGPAAALAPTSTGMHRGELRGVFARSPQHRPAPTATQRLEHALQALADATQALLAAPADQDAQANAQICVYAARNTLDLQALDAAEAYRQARNAAAHSTACDYHGATA